MQIIVTITPIFLVILLGWVARKRSFITSGFLEPANRLVYYLSIPAMIFSSIAKTSFHEQFNGLVLLLTLLAAVLLYLGADILVRLLKITPSRAGAFVQSSGHSNLGYIGLPVSFYYLGDSGLAKASIICGFLMILQNLMSVVVLQLHDVSDKKKLGIISLCKKLLANPVIIGAMAGIAVSVFEIPIPQVIERSLDILGGLAPPMALLLIGASLSLSLMRKYLRLTLGAVTLKLVVLPAVGLLLFSIFKVNVDEFLPALILICSPTATVAYVMAREMHGDGDFAVAAISASTLFASLTIVFWLTIVSYFTT